MAKCYYQDCTNTSACKNRSMFTFPIKNEHCLKIWVEHSGNPKLKSVPFQKLQRYHICEDHFSGKDIKMHLRKKKLVRNAVPVKYTPVTSPCPQVSSLEVQKARIPQNPSRSNVKPKKKVSPFCIDLPIETDPSSLLVEPSMIDPCFPYPDLIMPEETSLSDGESSILEEHLSEDTFNEHSVAEGEKDNSLHEPITQPALQNKNQTAGDRPKVKLNKKQIRNIAYLQKRNKLLTEKVRTLSLRSKKSKMMFFETLPFASKTAKIFAAMQLRTEKKVWSGEEKSLCISIYRKSPCTYICMRKKGIVLPSQSTVQRWLLEEKTNSTGTRLESKQTENEPFDFVNCDSAEP